MRIFQEKILNNHMIIINHERDVQDIGIRQMTGGWIGTNEAMQTNISNIYVCGDISGKKLYAYVAEHQARVCIENIIGSNRLEDYQGLAECVFTQPQVACVGIQEEEAKRKNLPYKITKSNFLRFSSSYVLSDTEGFIQVLSDPKGLIMGAAIISNFASEIISLLSLAIRSGLSTNHLKEATFIHPTISEILSDIFRH